MTQLPAQLRADIDVDASPNQVWALISDLRRMARWSPDVVKTIVRGGVSKQGARMININHKGLVVWPTRTKVVDFDPEKRLAWRVKENYTIWSFQLADTDAGGTKITLAREEPDGISDISHLLTRRVFGGHDVFSEHLLKGMHETLDRIKADLAS